MDKVKTITGVKLPLSVRLYSFVKKHKDVFRFVILRVPDIFVIICVYIMLWQMFGYNKLINFLLAISLYFLYKELIGDIKNIVTFLGGKK